MTDKAENTLDIPNEDPVLFDNALKETASKKTKKKLEKE